MTEEHSVSHKNGHRKSKDSLPTRRTTPTGNPKSTRGQFLHPPRPGKKHSCPAKSGRAVRLTTRPHPREPGARHGTGPTLPSQRVTERAQGAMPGNARARPHGFPHQERGGPPSSPGRSGQAVRAASRSALRRTHAADPRASPELHRETGEGQR